MLLSRATAGIPLLAGGHILSSAYRTSREKLCAAVGEQSLHAVVSSALTRPPADQPLVRQRWFW